MFYCILFSAFLFFIATTSLKAYANQPASGGWAATYGGVGEDWAASIRQTCDGGYIVAGRTASFGAGKGDLWLLKLGSDGTVEWQKSYGGASSDFATSIQQTDDEGYIVAGETRSFGAGETDVWVLKLKPDGTVEWQKTYGGAYSDWATFIQQTSDGGYIVAGYTQSFGAGKEDFWVLKLWADGSVEWQKIYGGDNLDEAHCIQQTSDGGYIVAGAKDNLDTEGGDLWVLKLRPDGSVEWQKSYGGASSDFATSIQQTNDAGYIVAGETGSFGAEETDVWVLKLKPDGTVEWQKTYGGAYSDWATFIQQTSDGGYIVAGVKDNLSTGGGDIWILKLKFDGEVEWQRAFGGVGWDWAQSIQQTRDNGYIIAGMTDSFGPDGFDSLVLKLSPDGSIHPSCDFLENTTVSKIDNNVTILDTNVTVKNSNANPQDSSAMILDTYISTKILCPTVPYYYDKPL